MFRMQKFHLKLIFHKRRRHLVEHLLHQLHQIKFSEMQLHLFVLQLDESKQFVRELLQTECFLIGNIDIMISRLLIQIRPRAHPAEIADNRSQRRTEVMCHG